MILAFFGVLAINPESFFDSGGKDKEILAMDDSERFRLTPCFFCCPLVVAPMWVGRGVLSPFTTNLVRFSADVVSKTSTSFAQVARPCSAPFPRKFLREVVPVSLDWRLWIAAGKSEAEGWSARFDD